MRRRTDPTARQRRAARERALGRCEYCRCPDSHSLDPFSIDHITPVSADGATTLDNLAYACLGGNGAKHDATTGTDPDTGQFEPLFHPRRDEWATHFA